MPTVVHPAFSIHLGISRWSISSQKKKPRIMSLLSFLGCPLIVFKGGVWKKTRSFPSDAILVALAKPVIKKGGEAWGLQEGSRNLGFLDFYFPPRYRGTQIYGFCNTKSSGIFQEVYYTPCCVIIKKLSYAWFA
jgi:hypothetical protein